MTVTKLGRIGIAGLNEAAKLACAGGCYLSRRPSTPTFWFYSLAIDANAHTFGPELRALLSDESKALLEYLDVGDFETAQDYCTCVDEAVQLSPILGEKFRGRTADPCWPCAFGCHERCSRGCTSSGEIHFPEKVLDPSFVASRPLPGEDVSPAARAEA